MYPPHHHQVSEKNKLLCVIEHYPLAMVVSALNNKPFITHTPMVYDQKNEVISGHVDKNNPHVAALKNGSEVQLIFKGPDTYISPSIYTTDQLPTWNYIIVHLTGLVSEIESEREAKKLLVQLTNFLERPNHDYQLKMDDVKMDQLIAYIHPFEVEITHWEGKFKLSQDKIEQDRIIAYEELKKNFRNRITPFFEDIKIIP